MEKLSNAFVPNFLLGIAGGIQYLKLKSASRKPRKTSEQTLRGILSYAKDTVYGKEHHFDEILRVKDPITHRLQHESFETFKAQCIAEGARDGQFKMNLLMQDDKRHAKFKNLTLDMRK